MPNSTWEYIHVCNNDSKYTISGYFMNIVCQQPSMKYTACKNIGPTITIWVVWESGYLFMYNFYSNTNWELKTSLYETCKIINVKHILKVSLLWRCGCLRYLHLMFTKSVISLGILHILAHPLNWDLSMRYMRSLGYFYISINKNLLYYQEKSIILYHCMKAKKKEKSGNSPLENQYFLTIFYLQNRADSAVL